MVKVIAPNKSYNGTSAGVTFADGVGQTDKPHLINWFKTHGYTVEELENQEVNKNAEEAPKVPEANEDPKEELLPEEAPKATEEKPQAPKAKK